MKTGLSGAKRAVAMACAGLLSACAHTSTPTSGYDPSAPPARGVPLAAKNAPAHHQTDLRSPDLNDKLRDDAPLHYVVKPGDTLWSIASYYLRDPWYWPQLWDQNPDIANPHRIYPGEVLTLARSIDGRPLLRGHPSQRLEPRVREAPLAEAIPTIPYSVVRDFIASPRLVSQHTLDSAPYVVSFTDEHLVAGAGDTAYIRDADPDGPRRFSIVRPGGPYKDAISGEILGQAALPVGQVTIKTFGPVSTGVVTESSREALNGDRLLPIASQDLVENFYPHAPADPISAHIISVYGGVTSIGQYDVVTLDRGRDAGLARGHVLNIFEAGRKVIDPIKGGQVQLPEVPAGQLMVFKTEDRVSYALVMRAQRAMHVDDIARSPTG